MPAPDWVSYAALGVSVVSLVGTTGLGLANRRRSRLERQEDIAPYLNVEVAQRAAVPEQGTPQSDIVFLMNLGPGDARNVGFLIELHGYSVSFDSTLLKAGQRFRTEPVFVRPVERGTGVIIEGVVFGEDRSGNTWARPLNRRRPRRMRRRGLRHRRPATPAEMFEVVNGRKPPPPQAKGAFQGIRSSAAEDIDGLP